MKGLKNIMNVYIKNFCRTMSYEIIIENDHLIKYTTIVSCLISTRTLTIKKRSHDTKKYTIVEIAQTRKTYSDGKFQIQRFIFA